MNKISINNNDNVWKKRKVTGHRLVHFTMFIIEINIVLLGRTAYSEEIFALAQEPLSFNIQPTEIQPFFVIYGSSITISVVVLLFNYLIIIFELKPYKLNYHHWLLDAIRKWQHFNRFPFILMCEANSIHLANGKPGDSFSFHLIYCVWIDILLKYYLILRNSSHWAGDASIDFRFFFSRVNSK